jgi:hypothetical protein
MQLPLRGSIRVAFSARYQPTTARRLSVSVMASKAPIYGELIDLIPALHPEGRLYC